MRWLGWCAVLLLGLLGGGVAALTLGAFAALVSDAPLWLRTLGSLTASLGPFGGAAAPGLTRALLLAVLSSTLFALAAYLKPR